MNLKLNSKVFLFGVLASLIASLLISVALLPSDPADAQTPADLIPPLCTNTINVRTCVPPPATACQNPSATLSSDNSYYTYTCSNGIAYVPASASCPANYSLETFPTDPMRPYVPSQYCEREPITAELDCRITHYRVRISESPLEYFRPCWEYVGEASPGNCPVGHVRLTNYEGHDIRLQASTRISLGDRSNPKAICLPFIERPTQCPRSSIENTQVISRSNGQCVEVFQREETTTTCPIGFNEGDFPFCLQNVANIPGPCPGSTITQFHISAYSLPVGEYAVGDLLPDISDEYPDISIYLQDGFPLLLSPVGKWFAISAADEIPIQTDGTPIPGICAALTGEPAPISCPTNSREISVLNNTNLMALGARARLIDIVCAEPAARPTTGCDAGQELVDLDEDSIPEACMFILARVLVCPRPSAEGRVVFELENMVCQELYVREGDTSVDPPVFPPCVSGFTEDNDLLAGACKRAVNRVPDCVATHPIFIVARAVGTTTTYSVNDPEFAFVGQSVIQDPFSNSLSVADQRCGRFVSLIPCLADISGHPISLDKDNCGGSSLSAVNRVPVLDTEMNPTACPSPGNSALIRDVSASAPLVLCLRVPGVLGNCPANSFSGFVITGFCFKGVSGSRSPTCAGNQVLIQISSGSSVIAPVVGTLLRANALATFPGTNTAHCIQPAQPVFVCPSSAPNFIPKDNGCYPDGVAIIRPTNCGLQPSTMSSTSFIPFVLNLATGECATAEEVVLPLLAEPEACPTTNPIIINGNLCGTRVEQERGFCDPNHLVVKSDVNDPTERANCYFPARYLCQGISASLGYIIFRDQILKTPDETDPNNVIGSAARVFCYSRLMDECPENYSLIFTRTALTANGGNDCISSDPNLDPQSATSSCAREQIPLFPRGLTFFQVDEDGAPTSIQASKFSGVFEYARIFSSLGLPTYPGDLDSINRGICGELAQLESAPACASGLTPVDTDGQDLTTTNVQVTNGILDSCFDANLPISCQARSGAECIVANTQYTASDCQVSRTLIQVENFYNNQNHNLCATTTVGERPAQCQGSNQFVYLTPERISLTPFLDATSPDYASTDLTLRQASKDGICGRFVRIADCGADSRYFAANEVEGGGAGCYETISRNTRAACVAGYEVAMVDGESVCVRSATSPGVAPSDAFAFLFPDVDCPDFDSLESPLVQVAPKASSFGSLIGRYFVAQPVEVGFIQPRTTIRCDSTSVPTEEYPQLVPRAVQVVVEELQPYIIPADPSNPSDPWVANPDLVAEGIDFGNWICINPPAPDIDTCQNTQAERTRLRQLYISLYGTGGPWEERIVELFSCPLSGDTCDQTVGTPALSFVDFTPTRATYYRISVILDWFYHESASGGATSIVSSLISSVSNIISVGEVQSNLL